MKKLILLLFSVFSYTALGAGFPIKDGVLQGTLNGTPTGGTVSFAALTFTIGNTTVPTGKTISFENGSTFNLGGSGGTRLDGSGGLLSFTGLGPGDEALAFDFDAGVNVIGISSPSGATDLNFGSLNVITTGNVSGNGSGLTNLDAGDIATGTLPVARGGTGTTTSTGTGSTVLSASPALTGAVTITAGTTDRALTITSGTSGDSIRVNTGAGFTDDLLDLRVDDDQMFVVNHDGSVELQNGSVVAPIITFASNTGSGMYYSPAGTDIWGFGMHGINELQLTPAGLYVTDTLFATDIEAADDLYVGDTLTVVGTITFTDNVRQTFNPGNITPGLNVGSFSGDPSAPSNGDVWYNSSANEFTVRINGVSVDLGASGGDVVGPASSTDNNIPIFDGVTGKLLKNLSTTNANIRFDEADGGIDNHFTVTQGSTSIARLDLDGLGQLSLGTATKTATRLTLQGTGTTTAKQAAGRNSSGTTVWYIQDNGRVYVEDTSATGYSALTANYPGSGGSTLTQLIHLGGSYSTYGVLTAATGAVYSTTTLSLVADNASGVIKFSTGGGAAEKMRLSAAGGLSVGSTTDAGAGNVLVSGEVKTSKTITGGGTTGAQTINKQAGSVNFAATDTTLVVTNSLVTTSTVIVCTVGTNDTTLKSVAAVAASGSFTLYGDAAATAETRVNFLIFN